MKSIWLARDKNGDLWGYISHIGKPIRKEKVFVSASQDNGITFIIPNDYFQEITWENSPVEFIQNKEEQQ